jgi:hypothetical protein
MKCFICYNKISYRIALTIRGEADVIVVRGKRIIPNETEKNILTYHWRTKLLLFCYCFSNVEIILPHWKHSNFLIILHRIARKISYVEDGLDTYRIKPKNIEASEMRLGAYYYFLDLGHQPEKWLGNFKLIPVPFTKHKLTSADCEKVKFLAEAKRICVESPGVKPQNLDDENTIIITHPSAHKQEHFINAKRTPENAFLDLESALAVCDQEIWCGETFTALILIGIYKKENVIICVDRLVTENAPLLSEATTPLIGS